MFRTIIGSPENYLGAVDLIAGGNRLVNGLLALGMNQATRFALFQSAHQL